MLTSFGSHSEYIPLAIFQRYHPGTFMSVAMQNIETGQARESLSKEKSWNFFILLNEH